jgi:hypothetical protein
MLLCVPLTFGVIPTQAFVEAMKLTEPGIELSNQKDNYIIQDEANTNSQSFPPIVDDSLLLDDSVVDFEPRSNGNRRRLCKQG